MATPRLKPSKNMLTTAGIPPKPTTKSNFLPEKGYPITPRLKPSKNMLTTAGIPPKPKTMKATPASQPNKVEKLIQDVTNRYRVTAREARDIITAAGKKWTTSDKVRVEGSLNNQTSYGYQKGKKRK